MLALLPQTAVESEAPRLATFPAVLGAIDVASSIDQLIALRNTALRRFRGPRRQLVVDARVARRVLDLLADPGA
jgi:hypothetical protein